MKFGVSGSIDANIIVWELATGFACKAAYTLEPGLGAPPRLPVSAVLAKWRYGIPRCCRVHIGSRSPERHVVVAVWGALTPVERLPMIAGCRRKDYSFVRVDVVGVAGAMAIAIAVAVVLFLMVSLLVFMLRLVL